MPKKGQVAWNKGLTAATDARVRKYTKANKGKKRTRASWNKGLTAETDKRVRKYGEPAPPR